jgi:hypothetical protein
VVTIIIDLGGSDGLVRIGRVVRGALAGEGAESVDRHDENAGHEEGVHAGADVADRGGGEGESSPEGCKGGSVGVRREIGLGERKHQPS